jgi:hypothetical protein
MTMAAAGVAAVVKQAQGRLNRQQAANTAVRPA